VHRGASNFTNIVVTQRDDGTITLDPHVTGACILTITEDEARALRNTFTEWLG